MSAQSQNTPQQTSSSTVLAMQRRFLIIAGISGALAVALGAFGAHALKTKLTPYSLDIYHTAVLYHFIHTLALLGVGLLFRAPSRWLTIAGWCFVFGIVIFSGSLYILAITGITMLGMIVPLGGLGFIGGWLSVMMGAIVTGKKAP